MWSARVLPGSSGSPRLKQYALVFMLNRELEGNVLKEVERSGSEGGG